MATPHVTGAAALCFAEGTRPGPCAGQTPLEAMATLLGGASGHATPANGFAGDPLHPGPSYFGNLLWIGPAPAAETKPATGVADHGATLNGTVDPNGQATGWWFEWGTSPAYGQTTPTQQLADPSALATPQAGIAGLVAGTVYHYRVVASGNGWTIHGTDGTFKTTGTAPPPPPDTSIDAGPPAATRSDSAEFRFSAIAGPATGFECALDGAAWSPCASPIAYTSLAEKRHVFSVRALGPGGTDPSPARRLWSVDVTPPDTEISRGPSATTPDRTAAFWLGSTEGSSSFECSLDGSAWLGCSSAPTYSGLDLGGHTLEARAKDAAGNVDPTPARYEWTIIPPAPAVGGASPAGSPPGAPVVLAPAAPGALSGLVVTGIPAVRGFALRLALACRGFSRCAGTLELRCASGCPPGAAAVVGRRRVALGAGRSGRLSVLLGRAAVSALRRSGRMRLTVLLTSTGSSRTLGQFDLRRRVGTRFGVFPTQA
jgi:hypothetical protein